MGRKAERGGSVLERMQLPERYQLVRRIATGGMASVWCAEDQVLGRRVAVKLLSDPYAHDGTATRRFQREARVAARLSGHRHVVTIYDVGRTGDGRPFIVMEYLPGGTVADALRVGEVDRDQAVRWISEAASALDYAHGRGVIHRDIKPANLLLDCDRVLHVADFGIARIGTDETITRSDQVFGTAAYLSPERAVGRSATEASDRYSLAVAAFELLVGERPFTAEPFAAQARQHLEEPPPRASARNRGLPRSVDAVLQRGLAKAPEDRWPTACAFADALEGALHADASEPKTAVLRHPMTARRARRAGAAAGAAGAGAGAAVGAGALAGAGAPAAKAGAPAAKAGATAAKAGAPAAKPARPAQPVRATPVSTGTAVASRYARPRALALGALVAGAVAVAVILATQGSPQKVHTASHSGQAGTAARSPARHAAAAAPAPRKPAAKPAAPAPVHTASTPTTATHPAAPTPTGADALENQGHALMVAGSYQQAIPVLEHAVTTAPAGSLTYAYALFDLGHSLRLAGDPRQAVQVLWRRMQIPNQTGVVRSELQLALQELGQKSGASGGAAGKDKSPRGAAPAGPAADNGHGPQGNQD
jgi:serine/threonine-protein kinase